MVRQTYVQTSGDTKERTSGSDEAQVTQPRGLRVNDLWIANEARHP
jgi:hypothetical protein